MLDPILAAGGRRVRGRVTLDTTITGTIAAPRVTGSAQLAGGEVQDFVAGLYISTTSPPGLQGNGNTLRIAQFSAKAGPGTIGGERQHRRPGARPADRPHGDRAQRATAGQRSDHRGRSTPT